MPSDDKFATRLLKDGSVFYVPKENTTLNIIKPTLNYIEFSDDKEPVINMQTIEDNAGVDPLATALLVMYKKGFEDGKNS